MEWTRHTVCGKNTTIPVERCREQRVKAAAHKLLAACKLALPGLTELWNVHPAITALQDAIEAAEGVSNE